MKRFFIALCSLFAGALLAFPAAAFTTTTGATVNAGDLIKSPEFSAVYYFGADGKRYVFPNEKTYFTWYPNFANVRTISAGDLASTPLGGNVTYRPGTRWIKIQSDPTTYAVSKGGILRPIASESVAASLFGSDWNRNIDDLSDAFFVNYKVGAMINSASDFDATVLMNSDTNIDIDKMLASSPTGYIDVGQNSNFGANATLTIAPNTRVTWIAIDNSQPSIRITPPSSTGLAPIVSGTLSMGQTFSYVFPQTGTWTYTNANVSGSSSGTIVVQ